jgi:glycosyltransferase involved in cell wall biosynthesis
MWNGKKVSVALPTYNEKDSIYDCIQGFFETGVVDEVIVCNNNAAPGTSEEVARTPAIEVFESKQGYGYSCQRALAATTGDLIVLSEPDGSFEPRDIIKLLAYSSDFEVVLGSRTNRELIWTGSNMGWFMKWGNWAVGKYVEFIFNTTTISDVGCTMRLLSRPVLESIAPHFTIGGSHFGPEMMMLCIRSKASIIEIPMNYRPRVGKSMVTGNRWIAFLLGLRMIDLISRFRIRTMLGLGPAIERRGYESARRFQNSQG